MMIRALDHVLGTGAKVDLLRALAQLDTPTSGREAERLAGVAHGSARKALSELVAVGVLKLTTTPGTYLYEINRDHDFVPHLETLFRAEAARHAAVRDEVRDAIRKLDLKQKVVSVIVFGSAARGDTTPESDLDLLVLVKDAADSNAARDLVEAVSDRLRARYGARLSALVLTVSEARARHEQGDPLMRNIVAEGRTLTGMPIQEALDTW
jgi:predicted nucleotidyltransferase